MASIEFDINNTDFTGHPEAVGTALNITNNSMPYFTRGLERYAWIGPRSVTVGVGGSHTVLAANLVYVGNQGGPAFAADVTPSQPGELVTVWTNGVTCPFDTFTTSGRDIQSAIRTPDGSAGANTPVNFSSGEEFDVSCDLTIISGPGVRLTLVNDASGCGTNYVSNSLVLTTSASHSGVLIATETPATGYLQVGGAYTNYNFQMLNISLIRRT